MNAYSISKLADDACVSVHVVRDYMIRGLLHPARRTESGYNIFDDKTLGRLRFLRAAFESGIGLDRAGTHAGSSQAGPAVCKGSYRHRARPVQAYQWMSLAAASGEPTAAKVVADYAAQMKPEQLQQAQLLAEEWQRRQGTK